MCATRTGRSGIRRAPTAIAVAASWEPSNPTRRRPPSVGREASGSLRSAAGSSAACGVDVTSITLLHRPTAEGSCRSADPGPAVELRDIAGLGDEVGTAEEHELDEATQGDHHRQED